MKVHLIHGIHTGAISPVQNLIPYLEKVGFEVCYPDYGWILGVETRIVNPIIRGALMPYIGPQDALIGHSNGCAVCYDLMRAGAPAREAVFINAALEQNITRPVGCEHIDVYYNPGDDITEAAKIAERLGIVDPVWGEMGHAGYSGADGMINNVNCGTTPAMPMVSGHSEFFDPQNIESWGPYLANRLAARPHAITVPTLPPA